MSMDRRNSFLMTALVVVAAAWAALAYAAAQRSSFGKRFGTVEVSHYPSAVSHIRIWWHRCRRFTRRKVCSENRHSDGRNVVADGFQNYHDTRSPVAADQNSISTRARHESNSPLTVDLKFPVRIEAKKRATHNADELSGIARKSTFSQ